MEKTYQVVSPGTPPVKEGKGFYIGLDLGQSRDYTALIILEKVWIRGKMDHRGRAVFEHHIREAFRFPLGTPYPDIVGAAKPYLLVDATGVGAAIRDEFQKLGVRSPTLRPVIITGGVDENFEKGSYRVPKSRLLERMQVDAQFGLLKIAGGMEELVTLKRELVNVKPKMKPETAYLSYEEIREGEHDDLVLAAALAHWGAHKFQSQPPVMKFRGW
jgi:hypothetical protein